MKRRVTNVTRLANQLTDPKPEFVSLVGHGANQEPFKTLKADIADFRETNLEEDMAKSKKEAKQPNQAEVQRVEFTGKKFADEATVKEYLEAKGYTDFAVTKTDSGFTVQAKEEADFEGAVKSIDIDEGVKFFVGKLAEGKDKLEQKTEVQKEEKLFKADGQTADEIVKKYYDCCGCAPTWTPPEGKTVSDVISEQFKDGTFPGLWQLNDAFYYAMYNLIKDGEIESVKTLANEYGELIVAILNVLKSKGADTSAMKALFIEKPEDTTEMTTKTEKAPGKTVAKNEEVAAQGEEAAATETATAETTDEAAATETAATETQDSAATEQKAVAPDMAEVIAAAVAKAITPIQESIATLQASVTDTQKAATDGLADLKEQVSKTGDRVNELETARQTRKSADDSGIASGNPEPQLGEEEKAQKAHSDRMLKSRLGIDF